MCRQAVTDAALKVFRREGFARTSTDAIATEALSSMWNCLPNGADLAIPMALCASKEPLALSFSAIHGRLQILQREIPALASLS